MEHEGGSPSSYNTLVYTSEGTISIYIRRFQGLQSFQEALLTE